ncbi:fibronectin type III domain-containing protein [Clostridium aestuarii]|uniref:Fibronectin type III domain-containing protein n=1 Tax=Clostridium aestuarii TaxID=338193 RepID=A0ABT4CWK9_9CLOT|nr:fibronectin type III domain-containing protein [Clostridium aestuarii]
MNSNEKPEENEKNDSQGNSSTGLSNSPKEDKQNLELKDGQLKTEDSVSKPSVPKELNIIKVGTNDITLSWSKVSQAVSYNIYRSLSKDGKYVRIDTPKGTSYTDKGLMPSTKYWYEISAINSSGEGNFSSIISSITKEKVKNKIGNTSANINNEGYTAVQGDWIYYQNWGSEPQGMLHKIKTNGTQDQKVQ